MNNEAQAFDATATVDGELKCRDCGAVLKYAPGTAKLKCEYCGAANEIAAADVAVQTEAVREIEFERFLSERFDKEEKQTVVTVKCGGCGANVSLKPNVTSDACPFCATNLVVTNGSTSSILKPKSLLPFKIEQKAAFQKFRDWLGGLWFAPNQLKRYAQSDSRLTGMYIPYWTYDSSTRSAYAGERGTDYTVSESYTTVENGKSVTKTIQVTRTRWDPVAGRVARDFDDVLVVASRSLPENYARALEPWDLQELVAFNEKFLSGYRTESYQVDVKQGWGKAMGIMEDTIRADVCRDIGGDHQRIHSLNTSYDATTFKHALLPIWISAYRYHGKAYRFLVNGRTGEVQGERPWSWAKIAGAVLVILSLIGIGLYFGGE